MSCPSIRRLGVLLGALLVLSCVLAGAAAASTDQIAYVANQTDGTVTPLDLTTGTALTPFSVGSAPAAVAVTPDGGTLLVANSGDDTVTPVTISSGSSGLTYAAGTPIEVGSRPQAIAVTADGMTAYVADDGADTITPITLEGVDAPGTPLPVASGPNAIALTPNGELAYVTSDSGWVTPIITSTNHIGQTPPVIRVSSNPDSIVISPDGTTGYVTDSTGGTITRFAIPSDKVETPINIGATPNAIAIAPDGSAVWVADNIGTFTAPQFALTEVSLPSGTVGTSIALPAQPSSLTISADGTTAFVTEASTNQVIAVNLQSGTTSTPITVGNDPSSLAIAPLAGSDPSGSGSGPGSGSGGTGTGGTGGTGGDPYTFPVSGHQSGGLGNQRLTLSTNGTTTSPTAACLYPKGNLTTKLTAKSLKRGAKVRFLSGAVTLGKAKRNVHHLPATVKLPLKGLSSGQHPVTATLVYSQKRHGAWSGHLSKRLRANIRIC